MPFRDRTYSCPSCRVALVAGDLLASCGQCGGAWVGEGELEERVRIVRGKHELELSLVFAPPAALRPEKGPCPTCNERLIPIAIAEVPVDRCKRKHGIWFDAEELQLVLHRAHAGEGVHVAELDHSGTELDVRGPAQQESITALDIADGVGTGAAIIDFILSIIDAIA